jgi:hypothetical protein
MIVQLTGRKLGGCIAGPPFRMSVAAQFGAVLVGLAGCIAGPPFRMSAAPGGVADDFDASKVGLGMRGNTLHSPNRHREPGQSRTGLRSPLSPQQRLGPPLPATEIRSPSPRRGRGVRGEGEHGAQPQPPTSQRPSAHTNRARTTRLEKTPRPPLRRFQIPAAIFRSATTSSISCAWDADSYWNSMAAIMANPPRRITMPREMPGSVHKASTCCDSGTIR